MDRLIDFNEWKKLDIRIGLVKEVIDHPNADKLYILKIDIGNKETKVVSGLKDYYTKEDLLNKKFVFFTNLKSANLRGEQSNGMILAAVKNNKVVLLQPDKDIEQGAKIE